MEKIALQFLRGKLSLVVLLLVYSTIVTAQTGDDHLQKMYTRYKKNWYRTLSFTQDTEIYRNDSLIRKQVWFERARFPHDLRIDVDSVNGGNKIFYLKDSTYRVRNFKIQSAAVDPNPFVFFLGGLYMMPLDSVRSILKREGYKLELSGSTEWKGRKTFIIGASNDQDSARNQFWVDAEHLYIVRIRLQLGGALFDAHLNNHVPLGKAWCETEVRFYRSGKLLQVEHYRDLKPNVEIGAEVFDVGRFR